MRNQRAHLRLNLITAVASAGALCVSGFAFAAPPPQAAQPAPVHPQPTVQPNTPTITPANTVGNTQSNTQPNTVHLQPPRDTDHDHDRDGDRRGAVNNLPWWGYMTGPDGWSGTDGWTPYDNNPNNPPNPYAGNGYNTPSDTRTVPATTMPSQQPSAAGSAAQTTNAVDKSPEMIAANNAVHTAQAEYDKQRERVLSQLRNSPEYSKIAHRREEATKDLKTTGSTVTTQPAVVEAATAKLDASSEVTKMEERAIASDPDASAAKSHLANAIANRDAQRAKLARQY